MIQYLIEFPVTFLQEVSDETITVLTASEHQSANKTSSDRYCEANVSWPTVNKTLTTLIKLS